MSKQGLFIGLVTLDFIYLSAIFPEKNEKIVALDHTIAAGGPATNAAVTFAYLGNQATWLGIIGNHPLSHLIKADLSPLQIRVIDLEPERQESPPVSSIIITQATGERAVISLNTTKFQASVTNIPASILEGIAVVLIDGHQMAISEAIAKQAQLQGIPVVMDGGSWKSGLETVLPWVDYAICSANFLPPGCNHSEDVFAYLCNLGIKHLAITNGAAPIEYYYEGKRGKLHVAKIQPVDTLGAGDIFHGAFCHYILQQDFITALESASKVATYSCQFFGTRQWLAMITMIR